MKRNMSEVGVMFGCLVIAILLILLYIQLDYIGDIQTQLLLQERVNTCANFFRLDVPASERPAYCK